MSHLEASETRLEDKSTMNGISRYHLHNADFIKTKYDHDETKEIKIHNIKKVKHPSQI